MDSSLEVPDYAGNFAIHMSLIQVAPDRALLSSGQCMPDTPMNLPSVALRFQAVCKQYGKSPVLRGTSFDIEEGTICGLVGVNGAGKTTLIKCLLDFCAIDAGSIEIRGRRHDQPGARAQLAYLPERFTPPHFMTGRQFLRTLGQLGGIADAAPGLLLAEAARRGLAEGDLDKPVRALSKGMTQKLGLAWIELSGRQLIVLDEPMSGLDPRARSGFKDMLAGLRDQHRTVLLTSHSLADVGEICDHMLVLHQGVIAYSGAPAGLCRLQDTADLERAFLRCIGSDG